MRGSKERPLVFYLKNSVITLSNDFYNTKKCFQVKPTCNMIKVIVYLIGYFALAQNPKMADHQKTLNC